MLYGTPTQTSWGFFLSDRASSRVFAGVRAEACGLRPSARVPAQGLFPLSPGHSSLQLRSPNPARSPQRHKTSSFIFNELRADSDERFDERIGSAEKILPIVKVNFSALPAAGKFGNIGLQVTRYPPFRGDVGSSPCESSVGNEWQLCGTFSNSYSVPNARHSSSLGTNGRFPSEGAHRLTGSHSSGAGVLLANWGAEGM